MRTNAGYIITHSCVIESNKEVVLGCTVGDRYVTWLCYNGDNYCFGHYFNSYKEALIDFGERIASEAEYVQGVIYMNPYPGMNILEYIEWLMDECGMSEEAAEREAHSAFGFGSYDDED